MPYKTEGPRREVHPDHAQFVDTLVEEMRLGDKGNGPDILEQRVRNSDRLHVYVIWNKWADVREEQRSAAILDAYTRHFGDEKMRQMSIAMGLTPDEAKSLGITS